jgi:hypothetical protein
LERAWFNTVGGADLGIEESGRLDELHDLDARFRAKWAQIAPTGRRSAL